MTASIAETPPQPGNGPRRVSLRASRRARQALPTIQLTLLSIIVALAFENLIEHVRNLPELWQTSTAAMLGWLQVMAITATVIAMWAGLSLQITLSSRAPGGADFLTPIAFLALLHIGIGAIGGASAHVFLYATAGGAALGGLTLWRESRNPQSGRRWSTGAMAALAQFALAAVTACGAVLIHAAVVGLRGTLAFTTAYLALQTVSATLGIRGWRQLLMRTM
jgi:hypothetical protein